MHRPLSLGSLIIVMHLLALTARPVLAQQESETSSESSADAAPTEGAAEAAPRGVSPLAPDVALLARAHVVLFVAGQPIAGAEVVFGEDGPSAVTNEDGAVNLAASQGASAALRVAVPTRVLDVHTSAATVFVKTPPVELIPGETVEVIITVGLQGGIEKFILEAPKGDARGARAEQDRMAELERLPKGTLQGVVTSLEDQKPIKGAQVFVRGLSVEATTDAQGKFVLRLPMGTHDISVIHASYSTQSKTGLTITAGATTETLLQLSPASLELEEFVVLAPHVAGSVASLVQERRESSAVSDVLGAQEMSRSGASDAASALQRVTGINIIGGRYVFVRGMGDRYSATLLNGQMIPSPDPERRVIPLDLFPVQVLEGVVIQKTFSPDMPAEFGGGMVQLRTRSYPEKFTLNINLSLGLNTQMTFATAPTHEGGSLDWIGTDDGSRELPKEIAENSPLRLGNVFQEGYTRDELAQFGTLLENNYNVTKTTVPLNRKVGVTVGDRWTLGKATLGYFASGIYSDDYEFLRTLVRNYSLPSTPGDPLKVLDDFRVTTFLRTISSGGIVAVGAEYLPGQKITATSLLLRVTDISTDVVSGFNENLGTDFRQIRLRLLERQMWAQQLVGEQNLGFLNDAKLEWRLSSARANLDEPDRREYLYILPQEQTDYRLGDLNTRNYSVLQDDVNNANIDWTQPLWRPEAKLKLGTMLVYRERNADTLRFQLRPESPRIGPDVARQSPEQVFRPENFDGTGGFRLVDITQGSDAYTAVQRFQAGYLLTEIPLSEKLEIMGGARVERSVQDVTTFDRFDPNVIVKSKLDNTDILPAATTTWKLSDDMALRAGFGRTVSRPDFRELSPTIFIDVTNGFQYIGNPELQRATINNYDARYEWYFSTDELVSLGAFYKTFDEPIELVILGGAAPTFTWRNAQSATNFGVEFETRKSLDFVNDELEDFFVASNVAIIKSNVDIGEQSGQTATSQERPLQGQAPYVVNAQIGYDDSLDAELGTSVTLLYNVTGPYIAQVGQQGLPDMFQQPVHQVDLVLRQSLPLNMTLSFRAQNILNPKFEQTQSGQVARSFKRGRGFSISLQWDY